MSEPTQKELKQQSRRIKQGLLLHFPWLTLFASMALVVYLLILSQPDVIQPYYILDEFKTDVFQWSLVALFVLFIGQDLYFYFRRQKRLRQAIEQLDAEVDDLWRAKKKVQEKAHVYSSHADKLKLFISDKLLEYIEYDEKYLHFKSIASEVRHNGVISFDKVRSALTAALLQTQKDLDDLSQQEEPTQNLINDKKQQLELYQQAIDAQKYLWDLLDLSTADNIALHIANYLINCEEQYYQQELKKNDQVASLLPVEVSFLPMTALVRTFSGIVEVEESEATRAFIEQNDLARTFLELSNFRVGVDNCNALLGNPNHFILLLENLIKNAQFFHGKRKNRQPSDKLAVQLIQNSGYIEVSVYNRGKHISNEHKEQIFQLGFSTRKVKEHHGKGLGLFFVNEIVKGYEGKVDITNVANPSQTLTLRMLTSNDMVVTKVIHIIEQDGKVFVREAEQQEFESLITWEYAVPVVSVEVSVTSSDSTHHFGDIADNEDYQYLDPVSPFIPAWQLDIKNARKAYKVQFKPLDRTGVVFSVKLPDVEARINDENPLLENNFDGEVEKLEQQFKEFEEY